MNTRILIIILSLLLPNLVHGQFKHYIGYNTLVYQNFYNRENDKFQLKQSMLIPAMSYKIERKNIGIEVFFNSQPKNYYVLGGKIKPQINSITQIISHNLGLTTHYNILNKHYLKICPMLGIIKNWYDAMVIDYVGLNQNGEWWESILHHEKESKLGLVGGVNINAPIYKKFYANTNIRYSYFPTAKYNKQNFMWEVGIGYMLQ
jgi:hypothetical protein